MWNTTPSPNFLTISFFAVVAMGLDVVWAALVAVNVCSLDPCSICLSPRRLVSILPVGGIRHSEIPKIEHVTGFANFQVQRALLVVFLRNLSGKSNPSHNGQKWRSIS